MRATLELQPAENESCSGQVAGAGILRSLLPAMALHDAQRIAPILDGIRSLHLRHKRGFRDALGHCCAGHDIRLNKSIAISSPGEDEPWRNTSLVLVHSLGDAGQLLRG